MIVLGIESSCDETAVAIVNSKRNIIAHEIFSQVKMHTKFGGVVPEIAARQHVLILPHLVEKVFEVCGLALADIDAIAVTAGPGLIGGVIVGVMLAKGIASVSKKPCIAVNHLEGHALTVRLTSNIEFPYLLLLLSGGHCQILLVRGVGDYVKFGETLDDALGEAFDKVAKILDLGYPGGPIVEELAKKGDETRFNFPKPLYKQNGCNFSFSGLKTAVMLCAKRLMNSESKLSNKDKCDVCASFQKTVTIILQDRLLQAMKILLIQYPHIHLRTIVLAGGVAANQYIRAKLSNFLSLHYVNTLAAINHNLGKIQANQLQVDNAQEEINQHHKIELIAPPPSLCIDNAAMIAWVGIEKLHIYAKYGAKDIGTDLSFEPRSKWQLV